ncbi:chorismate mutase [Pararhodospirillum oryzae]|uniref:chorismate mutase n=1 Tax=Pararhodospirillum oryzae TaxID=478448 RepID=A0A512H700_9PROT|nr:chorismate mutase [Pararhodospirillum oryzae]GEO81208.1 chorismate mutase [Pararhodospirillum oryzae]
MADRIRLAKQAEGTGGVYLRPGREAAVLRRLVARHQGPFPRRVLVRLWREIFSVSVSMQGRITLAVWMPERGAGYLELARNQFGSFTSGTVHQSVGQVVQEVGEGRATVGVVPLPRPEDAIAWWPALMSTLPGTPRVIVRLPVTGGRNGLEALVIAALDPEPSAGEDRSLLGLETGPDLSRTGLLDSLRANGFDPLAVLDARAQGEDVRLTLIEVRGPVLRDDARLQGLQGGHHSPVQHAVVIGTYALPFTDAELDGP